MKKRILKIIKRTLIIVLTPGLVLGLCTWLYMQKATFGSLPSGKSKQRIQKSAQYKNGEFQNRIYTPTLAPGYTFWGVLRKQFFDKAVPTEPSGTILSVKTDLKHLPANKNLLVWFGHSSTLLQIDGKKILIDPIFSDNASPLPNTVKVFDGTNTYHVQDLPQIDYLIISHDHYDHLDYPTVLALKDKVKKVICGLGVGAHFERWGYPKDKIIEEDWNDSITVAKDFTIHTLPARHKSGRGLKQNQSLWASYLIHSPTIKVFYSGDGGYDTHFAEIGKKFGPIDVAIMENGQYNKAWHYIHMLPEETLQAAQDLKAKSIVPVHNSKFALAKHTWNEPLNELNRLNSKYHIPLITPVIGEIVIFDDHKVFKPWWKDRSINSVK
ncbi:L-ascorbate metabolism protein UlaG (beta-lactamase superfamily) [Flavobacterium araucananum]|uniref:MBL fold metallo-hydrolase n=1 Tax=Flavobacterium araucananum TaxID=946678 RepID=A0A227P2K8_9FLAO|nr:MBL fold metallo-hydrolase [Flavobacterium araucananum]OXG04119.1 MBL fold metallo-hydrolase [Flavobacterium araucananum]PWK01220.1 L-ascorbate metabolism protein UlaG (beta-lactamase superfamily) [Flavobacterium araucananum]